MPSYSYYCGICSDYVILNVPIANRDNQDCEICGGALERKIDAPAAVWNPTRTNGRMRT